MKKLFYTLLTINIILLSGCANIDYETLTPYSPIKNNTSVVLIGTKGKQTVNYLQFESWSKMPPACNYRFYENDNIIALKIDTPQNEFSLGVYTTVDTTAGYTHTGVGYGYIPVESKGINIKEKGIYYYGILDTDTQTIDQSIDKSFLAKAKKKYKKLINNLKPINFKW